MRRVFTHLPSPAMLVALLALFVTMGSGAYAALVVPANSVGNKQLKNSAVTAAKVKPGALLAKDFKAGQLPRGAKGDTGWQGPPGPSGAQGAAGAQGPKGDTGASAPAGSARAVGSVASDPFSQVPAFLPGELKGWVKVVGSSGRYCLTADSTVNPSVSVLLVGLRSGPGSAVWGGYCTPGDPTSGFLVTTYNSSGVASTGIAFTAVIP
jgi:hypothetical protein